MLLSHFLPLRGNSEITLNYISWFVLCCVCHNPFEIWNAILKRKDFLEVVAINGKIILKCI
jgi:hypothetical protein